MLLNLTVSMYIGEQVGLTTMNIVIGDFNKDEFVPGNAATSGNFPGFQLGLMYRIYVEYFAADGTALNAGTELSVFRTPIIKASPPLVSPDLKFVCVAHTHASFVFFLIP